MKGLLFLFGLLMLGLNGFSQNLNGLTISTSRTLSDLQEKTGGFSPSFDNYKVSVAIKFFNKLNTGVEVGFMNISKRQYNNSFKSNIKVIKLGLDIDYRFLKNSIVSPKIALGGGFFPYSNMKGKHVLYSKSSLDLLIDNKNKSKSIFESWKGYADAQLFLSIKLTNLFLDIGGGLGYMGYSFKDDDRHNLFGPELTFKLSYVFSLNKKVKD